MIDRVHFVDGQQWTPLIVESVLVDVLIYRRLVELTHLLFLDYFRTYTRL